MGQEAAIEALRRWSHVLLWVSIVLPLLGALAAGARYYVDRRVSALTGASTMAAIADARVEASAAAVEAAKARAQQGMLAAELTHSRADLERVRAEAREAAAPPRLSLRSQHTQVRADHLVALLQFAPSRNAPLGNLVFDVRVAQTCSSRIVGLVPTVEGGAFLSGSGSTKIAADGKSAALRYALVSGGLPTFEVELTGPATLGIAGSHIVEPVFISIAAADDRR